MVFSARPDTGNTAWNGVGRYFLFFMIGCFLRDRVVRAVEGRHPAWALVLGAGFLVMALPVFALQHRLPGITGVLVVASACAVGAGLLLARVVDRTRGFGWVAWVGQHTLPVYVLHVLLVSALTTALTRWRGAPALEALAPALPVLVAVAAVAGSLAVWRATRDVPVVRHLYAPPAPLTAPAERSAPAARTPARRSAPHPGWDAGRSRRSSGASPPRRRSARPAPASAVEGGGPFEAGRRGHPPGGDVTRVPAPPPGGPRTR